MKAIDMHSHYSTKRAYMWRTPEEVAIAEQKYRFRADYKTEEEMAQDLRGADVKGVFDLGFTTEIPLDEAKEMHELPTEQWESVIKVDVTGTFLFFWLLMHLIILPVQQL